MKVDDPVVSVIVPSYYRNEHLQEAIESVFDQSYRPVEVIVVDDSGEAYAEGVVERYPGVTYIPLAENRGQNAALNRGLEQVRGDYVQFLDDDDLILEGKFDEQVRRLEDESEMGVAYCRLITADDQLSDPPPDGEGDVLEHALRLHLDSCVTSTMLFDRECLEAVAPLPTPPGSTDNYMKIELAQRTEFAFVDVVGVFKREHPNAVSESEGAIVGRRQLFDHYADLYDEFPPDVRRQALVIYHNRAGEYYVNNRGWSARGIRCFSMAVYYDPGTKLFYLGRLIGSLFGRPGLALVDWCIGLAGTALRR